MRRFDAAATFIGRKIRVESLKLVGQKIAWEALKGDATVT
jgi:hypothetical protein